MAKRATYTKHDRDNENHNGSHNRNKLVEKQASWLVVKNIFTCKHLQLTPQVSHTVQQQKPKEAAEEPSVKGIARTRNKVNYCSASLCRTSNTKAIHRPEPQPHSPQDRKKKKKMTTTAISNKPNDRVVGVLSNSSSDHGNGSLKGSKGIPFMKLTGCYECRMVVDPVLGLRRLDASLRSSVCCCSDCGEIFMNAEALELHCAVRHAVCELGPEDSSRNIVEIIFQSSWLRKQNESSSPMICKINRILKIQNSRKTISRFEEYRDTIKTKSSNLPNKKLHPRCIADGNELLRFHSTTFICSLGLDGSSNLCSSIPHCKACSIIKNGFKVARGGNGGGILTTATSGKAHENAVGMRREEEEEDGTVTQAMLVCRVIAGRVKKNMEDGGGLEEYDSVVRASATYSNPEELYVFNPRAILPCFVVVYGRF